MNDELHRLFEADQADHHTPLTAGTPEYQQLRERDRQRRQRVATLIAGPVAEGAPLVAEDYFHAAIILHHGETPDEIRQAHTLASTAAERGHPGAKWLAAAALDRWLMYQGRPQKFGTQIVPDGTRWRLWDTDPTTTDADRAECDVPSLDDQLERARSMTGPQPPMEDAPWWLKEAIKGWK